MRKMATDGGCGCTKLIVCCGCGSLICCSYPNPPLTRRARIQKPASLFTVVARKSGGTRNLTTSLTVNSFELSGVVVMPDDPVDCRTSAHSNPFQYSQLTTCGKNCCVGTWEPLRSGTCAGSR